MRTNFAQYLKPGPRHALHLWALGALLTPLAWSAASYGQQNPVNSGVVDSVGVTLGNNEVLYRFFRDSATSPISLDITDLQTNHVYRHRRSDLWQAELISTDPDANGTALELVLPSGCPGSILWEKPFSPIGEKRLALRWSNCDSTSGLGGTIAVQLNISLKDGEMLADWQLLFTPAAPLFSLWSGALQLGIEEDDQSSSVEHFLLDPFSQLTQNPGSNLPTWSLGTPAANAPPGFQQPVLRLMPQLAAYYDDEGHGLYVAGADTTGVRMRTFQFNRVDPSAPEELPLVEYRVISFADDVFVASSPLQSVPVKIGRFHGDWYDAADCYRSWFEDETNLDSGGLLSERTDISDEVKRTQQTVALGGNEDYFDSTLFPGSSMADRIIAYKTHWGLDNVTVFQFGNEWTVENNCGRGTYAFDPLWQANLDEMTGKGIPLLLYLLDHEYALWWPFPATPPICFDDSGPCIIDDSFWADNDPLPWSEYATRTLTDGDGDGVQDLVVNGTCGNVAPPQAFIDPSTTRWQERMYEVAERLGELGASGIYIDNLNPNVNEVCFARDEDFGEHSHHKPGFSDSYIQGLADTMSALTAGGNSGRDTLGLEGFLVATENEGLEAYIAASGFMGAEFEISDFLIEAGQTDNPATTFVPLRTTLYHHYALMRSASPYRPFMIDPLLLGAFPDPQANTTLSSLPAEQAKGRRGAAYAMACATVNGMPLRNPDDFAQRNPENFLWSFERPPGTNPDYAAVVDFGSRLTQFRGVDGLHEFLGLGKRMRDVTWEIGPLLVTIPLVANRLNIVEMESRPAVVQGVWKDLLTGDIGLALANHSDATATGLVFQWVPTDYGLGTGPVDVCELDATGQATFLTTLPGGPSLQPVPPIDPETMRFFRFSKQ